MVFDSWWIQQLPVKEGAMYFSCQLTQLGVKLKLSYVV
jgi:hypothetical protein